MFEIEKRSLLRSREAFEIFESKIKKISKSKDIYIYKTFLFNDPKYLRIRITLNKSKAEITSKTGTYNDPARKEINKYLELEKLPTYLKKLEESGFKKCVSIKTKSHNYSYNGLSIAINDIEHLGMIVEVEGITNNEMEILNIEKKVIKTMRKLNIIELDPNIYQEMMDNLYKNHLKAIQEHSFLI